MADQRHNISCDPVAPLAESSDFTSIDSLPVSEGEATVVDESIYEVPTTALVKEPVTCRAAVWGTLAIMSVAGLLSVYLHHHKHYAVPVARAKEIQELNSTDKDFKETAEQTNYNANIANISARCSKMVSAQNSIAVFEHGTCVLVIEPSQDPVNSAKSSLQILADPEVEFQVKALNNNNYLVVFNKYIFCWLFAEDIAKNKKSIMADKRLDSPPASLSSEDKMSPFEKRLGKLARLMMLKDSESVAVKKILRAKGGATPPGAKPQQGPGIGPLLPGAQPAGGQAPGSAATEGVPQPSTGLLPSSADLSLSP